MPVFVSAPNVPESVIAIECDSASWQLASYRRVSVSECVPESVIARECDSAAS